MIVKYFENEEARIELLYDNGEWFVETKYKDCDAKEVFTDNEYTCKKHFEIKRGEIE